MKIVGQVRVCDIPSARCNGALLNSVISCITQELQYRLCIRFYCCARKKETGQRSQICPCQPPQTSHHRYVWVPKQLWGQACNNIVEIRSLLPKKSQERIPSPPSSGTAPVLRGIALAALPEGAYNYRQL